MEAASRRAWLDFADGSGGLAETFRPINFLLTKAVYQIHGPDFLVFRGVQLATLVALFIAWVKACDPRTGPDFWRFAIATACLLGLHTTRFLFHGIPLNPYTIVSAAGLWTIVVSRQPPNRLSWLWPAIVTFLALLTVELGVVIPFLIVAACLAGWPGATRRGALGAAGVLAAYAIVRASFGSGLDDSPFYTDTGFGYDVLDVAQQERLFGARPFLFYAYNATSTLMTVLASEPRGGIFEFVRAMSRHTGVAPWQWINVITSVATTAMIAWAASDYRRTRLLGVAFTGMLVNAVLGFLYTRDRISSFAGLLYALCLYVSLGSIFEQLTKQRRAIRFAAVLVLSAVSGGWAMRVAGAHVALRDAAWVSRQEWVNRSIRTSEASSAEELAAAWLFTNLRQQAVARDVHDPRRDAPWTYRWLERDGSLR
jgi:hypothetical protein